MTGGLLVINAGSSSVKFRLFEHTASLPLLAHGEAAGLGTTPYLDITDEKNGKKTREPLAATATHEDALKALLHWIEGHGGIRMLAACGHRVVHGGTAFTKPVRMTSSIHAELEKLSPLAPLHQPHNLAAIDILGRLKPGVPQIACFDTAFHANHDPLFTLYALPQSLRDQGIRRYGFHGLSYEWLARSLRQQHPELARGRVIAAHLGNGASLCALKNGQSIDTTMGFTTLEGPPMGTRSGSIDPGVLLYMFRALGFSPEQAEHMLYQQSGLKGLSGATNDVKELLASNDARAALALDHFAFKVAQHAAMMAVSLGGVDSVVFTGGIGEHAGPVRTAILQRLAFLGQFTVQIIPADEERMIALHMLDVLGS